MEPETHPRARGAAAAAPLPAPDADTAAEAETLEWIERRAFQSLFCFASRAAREALGLRVHEAGPLFAGFAPRVDVPSLNRVLGLGLPPDSLSVLEAAVELGRRSGAPRVFLPVVPGPVGARAAARLLEQGFPAHNHWARVSLRLDRPFHAGYPGRRDGRWEIRLLGRPSASDFGSLAAEAFRLPAAAALLLADSVGAPGWTHFGAFWNGALAGAAALYREGSACWLGYGAVRETWRGQGAHAALIGERLAWARDAGCRLASLETLDGPAARPSPALRNLLRFGCELRYLRPNYLLRA